MTGIADIRFGTVPLHREAWALFLSANTIQNVL